MLFTLRHPGKPTSIRWVLWEMVVVTGLESLEWLACAFLVEQEFNSVWSVKGRGEDVNPYPQPGPRQWDPPPTSSVLGMQLCPPSKWAPFSRE